MSTSTEEYLEALYTLTRESEPVSTSAISKRLNIAPASVTEMMQKLAAEGYVNYSPYQGVTLTPKGYQLAEKMTRKHRLLEKFLHDVLKIGKDKVHKEACEMEHAISDETARAICQALKAPDRCPDDGQFIPPCDLGFSSCEECRKWGKSNPEDIKKRQNNIFSMSTLKENQEGRISFIRGGSKAIRHLAELGLTPGTDIKVCYISPVNGPVVITSHGSRLVLGDEIASNIFIEKAAE
jgi:DtxR family Mn-dependent transcriptional regulator